jgi:hypothetical protein
VDVYDLPGDTTRKKHRTEVVQNNGINPIYATKDEPGFTFDKVRGTL